MDHWAGFYERFFNFREVRYFDIEGKLTGLKSRAMTSPDGQIRIPINESADDKSQIEEYLHVYKGEGIQHIALGTGNIYDTVEALAARGVPFQDTPNTYYERLDNRIKGHGEDVDRLKRFAGTIYLTQTVERRDGQITHYLNMEDAIAAWEKHPGPREWRIHFHVPIFLERLGALQTTRSSTAQALQMHKATPLSRQVEIETYTWDVLPEEFKTGDIVEYVAREIEWAQSELV